MRDFVPLSSRDARRRGDQDMQRIFENKYWTMDRLRPALVLRVRRTDEAYASVEDVKASFTELDRSMSSYNRRLFSLLVDLRSAPKRNDPEYEKAAAQEPVILSRDFIRVAVLVATAAGQLQVGRIIRMSGIKMRLFDDEAEALEYLQPRRS